MKRRTYILIVVLAFFTWHTTAAELIYTPPSAGAIMTTQTWRGNVSPAFSGEAARVEPVSGSLRTPVFKSGPYKAPPKDDGSGGTNGPSIEVPISDANWFLLVLACAFVLFKVMCTRRKSF